MLKENRLNKRQVNLTVSKTNPFEFETRGALALKVNVHPQTTGLADVKGTLHVALSHTIDSALSFLPGFIRRQFTNGLMHHEMDGLLFRLRIPNLVEIHTDVTPQGVLTLSGKYHNPLAKPVGQGEVLKMFEHFGRELRHTGLEPHDTGLIDNFLHGFKRQNKGELDFLAIFENKTMRKGEQIMPAVQNLSMQTLGQSLDSRKNLVISFEAQGEIVETD